jgi:hypothetical protein
MIIITLNKKIINLPTSITINWPRLKIYLIIIMSQLLKDYYTY